MHCRAPCGTLAPTHCGTLGTVRTLGTETGKLIPVALVESLLTAMIRADGDALVMHVGEKPYVVVGAGTLDLSTQILTVDAMVGMLQQLLPSTAQSSLEEFGAVEHRLPSRDSDVFTVVAARGGDDIWIEIRRRRRVPAVAAPILPAAVLPEPVAAAVAPEPDPVVAAPPAEPVIAEVPESEPLVAEVPEFVAAEVPDQEPVVAEVPEPVVAEVPEPVAAEWPESVSAVEPTPVHEFAAVEAEAMAAEPVAAEPVVEQPLEDWAAMAEPPAPVMDEPLTAVAETLPVVIEAPLVVDEWPAPVVAEAPIEDAPEPAPLMVSEDVATAGEWDDLLLPDAAAEPLVEQPIPPISLAVSTPAELEAVAEDPAPLAEEAPLMVAEEAIPVEEAPPVMVAESPIENPIESEPLLAAETPALEVAADSSAGEPAAPPERAPVLQLARPLRAEMPPPRMAALHVSSIERLLREASARAASALFVISDSRPSIRVEGDVRLLEGEAVMSRSDVQAAVMEIVPEAEQEAVGRGDATEWITEFPDLGGVRCITFTDHRGPGVVFRMIATRTATAEQLGLSREVQALATESQGLVLVAGAHGSGKSTLVSALVDLVNRQRAEYVVTLERQIRLVHDNRTAIVSQREIRGGADEALSAARAALREDPDVLVVDDLASAPLVPLLLQAASEALVFVSITAPSTTEAVERFIEMAPADQRAGVQTAMAESFRGAVAQVLLKKAGGGRVSAREVLLATAVVTRVISDGVPGQLAVALEGGRKHGMVPLADALAGLVQSGVVDVREAFRKSPDRERLLSALKREGIDTSAVERLA